jgi:hypothetical protein
MKVIWVRRQVKILKNRNIFAAGPDCPNQIDPLQEISFSAQSAGSNPAPRNADQVTQRPG